MALVVFSAFHGMAEECEQDVCEFSSGSPRLGSGAMFDKIASRYDLINRVMSLGMDQWWRSWLVSSLDIEENDQVLDLATGTADVAIMIAQKHPGVSLVSGVDPSENMINIGRRKIQDLGLDTSVVLTVGDATDLRWMTSSYDKISMAFGIRNIPDRMAALKEIRRVIKPEMSSRLAILEFGEPEGGIIQAAARVFIHNVVPVIGALLSGKWSEYMHLERSIKEFPKTEDFADMLAQAGFYIVKIEKFAFSAVTLFICSPVPVARRE
eukprot:CAMPEP_0167748968 /NCGR_PEP_ID=MMETSP0110_2-20121227/5135_1 /TAXON_ID=629695 /ORGANISM="Gymnochlora sp., Strain CCMP2014" /LENGTH=266 /DNA_ID=CAMNT_0007634047 /DNA_START=2252 /DNA_END=3052 /DNA_ORIENTATION=-